MFNIGILMYNKKEVINEGGSHGKFKYDPVKFRRPI